MKVLEEERAILAGSLGLVWVRLRDAVGCGIDGLGRVGLTILLVGSELMLNVGGKRGVVRWCHDG